jgi:hypothetical protein
MPIACAAVRGLGWLILFLFSISFLLMKVVFFAGVCAATERFEVQSHTLAFM